MSAIRILPEQLANQIAAGEVVERPASVVKELLENAVDAGARTITVQVEGNATACIRVIDDGSGMDTDDLLLCLERHATSKLRDQAGMVAIKTMGFRGEALPSIASVSRLRIVSRPRGAELGGQVEVSFGTVRRVLEAGAPQGTSIEVRDLFGNVPARRKFLKTPRTELYHVEECVKNCGLAFPAIGLHYQVDGRTVLQWPAEVDDPAARIRRLLDVGGGGGLITIEAAAEIEVFGLLLLPEETPATGGRLRVFVNGRPVRDRMIGHAVGEGLRNQLARGRQPAGVVFIRLDPALVDVNVHPAKQEIRFQRSSAVHDAVRQAVAAAVGRHEQERRRTLFGPCAAKPAPAGPLSGEVAAGETAQPAEPQLRVPHHLPWPGSVGRAGGQVAEGSPDFIAAPAAPARGVQPAPAGRVAGVGWLTAGDDQPGPPRLLGQVLASYILCESGGGLLAVDQHAAHERLLFERLRRQYGEQGLARQALLFPVVIELNPAEAAVVESRAGEIARLGLELTPFGGNSYMVKAVPALLAGRAPEEVVAGVLAGFMEDGPARHSEATLEQVLAGMACQAAIKAGQRLEPEEMERLLAEMQSAGLFSRCPHGRPVFRRFEPEEMKRWFHR
ncbi:MAG TPA: DNA mismatch repair endonuclease MutL [Desulfurivibrio alkaliphilus]|uniref:DNA mismatch repair protein MutL n=1 Tax=Desulfurivibrio alkaliphilus TaxID=427923 RepID=A0A7C2XV02_9BACT|nr:DNA mismatch repair endonuclease MutL [Desulfurivibrio alkaliphilus]